MSKSPVWQFFKASADNSQAKCNFCPSVLQHKGSTTPLWNHYKAKHAHLSTESATDMQSENEEEPGCSQTDSGATSRKRKRPAKGTGRAVSDSRAEDITRGICKMIVSDMQPISIVDDSGFRALLEILEPGYKIPDRRTIDQRLKALYTEVRAKIETSFEEIEKMSLTTDAWTSLTTESYVTVSASYLDKDWSFKSITLATLACPERHTAENLQFGLLDVIHDWTLDDKVDAIAHDNAKNICNATAALEEIHGIEGVRCAAHTMQLAINTGLNQEDYAGIIKTV